MRVSGFLLGNKVMGLVGWERKRRRRRRRSNNQDSTRLLFNQTGHDETMLMTNADPLERHVTSLLFSLLSDTRTHSTPGKTATASYPPASLRAPGSGPRV